MSVTHNLTAINANGNLGKVSNNMAKSTEKLSSGYRINRSADDAAGLSISEKMRWQIRGLNRASVNIEDGVSLIQVADGALNETHDILHRMRELAVQAANDTNTAVDRQAIQSEIDELTKEIDSIADKTNFNGDIYPLKGTEEVVMSPVSGFTMDMVGETTFTCVNMAGEIMQYNGISLRTGESTQYTGISVYSGGQYYTFVDGYFNNNRGLTPLTGIIEDYGLGTPTFACSFSLGLNELKVNNEGYIYYMSKVDNCEVYFYREKDTGEVYMEWEIINDDAIEYLMASSTEKIEKQLWIQMGAQEGHGMYLDLVDATKEGLGLSDVDVLSHETASNALSNIDAAINKVSEYRSNFGAQQNRLEHAMKVDDNTAENTQAAESKIRDLDMAYEMTENSKYSILMQAGQAMLAQANQLPQGILTLLDM